MTKALGRLHDAFMGAVTDDVSWVLGGYYVMAAVFGLGSIMGWVIAKTEDVK